ncbi:MAG TPA: hypothetical protein VLB67_05945, partial [Acidimicrobiia bacterium]|nr:hypothetical protein [Acidimicrobiia bacterium]
MTPLLAAALSSLTIGLLAWAVLDPPTRLDRRVEPYLAHNRAAELWRSVRLRGADPRTAAGSLLSGIAERVGDAIDGHSREHLLKRLRQARLFQESDDPAATYRIRQFASVVAATSGAGMTGGMLGMAGGQVAGLC